ncbi:hypothetical protein LOAG_12709, partial [Loa loa]
EQLQKCKKLEQSLNSTAPAVTQSHGSRSFAIRQLAELLGQIACANTQGDSIIRQSTTTTIQQQRSNNTTVQ